MKLIAINLHCLLGTVLLFICVSVSGQVSNDPKLIIPFGHQSGIKYTLFSADNKFLITADDKITIISDVRSGKPLYYLKGTAPAISNNDKYVATVLDSMVMIWNMENGQRSTEVSVKLKAVQTAFNPLNDILIIKSLPGSESVRHEEEYYNIHVWDYINNKFLNEFYSNKQLDEPSATKCYSCEGRICPIYAAWFNQTGDSLRLIFKNSIKTFSINDFSGGNKVCLKAPGKSSARGTIKTLNNHFIELVDENNTYCFNEHGIFICSWSVKAETEFFIANGSDIISPALNFQASYSSSRIILRDLKNKSARFFQVKGLKKIRFNDAGTYMLAEYLNEEPKFISTTTGRDTTGLSEDDYKGWPVYVYETKTSVDAQAMAAVYDSIEVKMPAPKASDSMFLPFMQTMHERMKENMTNISQSIQNSFTNAGVIVNLYNNRVISKIQSLIKSSGDIRLSPNKKIMLVNSGKVISLYSLPYAKLLINLKGNAIENVFSPDSKWLFQYYSKGKTNIVNLVTGQIKVIELPLKENERYLVSFSPNCKNVFISSSKERVINVDVINGKQISNTGSLSYFYSETGDKFGVIDQASGKARILRTGDSVQLFEVDLNAKRPQGNTQHAFNWRIGFSRRSNAVVFWHERHIIFAYDIINAPDSIMNEPGAGGGGLIVTNITISPNGFYVNLQFSNGNAHIVNLKNIDSSFAVFEDVDERGRMNIDNIGDFIAEGLTGFNGMVSGNKDFAQFSETGDSVMACKGDSATIFLCATGEKLKRFHVDGKIKYFDFKGDVLVSYYYGLLKVLRIDDNKEWFRMIPFNTGETVFLLPNGIYFGSKSVTRHLGYMYEGKSLSYKQFDYSNNRPDIVLRAMGNGDKKYLDLYDAMVVIRRKREGLKDTIAVNLSKAPVVAIENDKEINGEVKNKELLLKLKINVKESYPDRLLVYINGNPVHGNKGIRLSGKTNLMDTAVKLILTEGPNAIEVSVFDKTGMESYRQPLYVQYSPDKPVLRNIYFAGIGAANYLNRSNNLLWAQKDVKDVLDSLRARYKKKIIVDTLFNNHVTLGNLKSLKVKFKRTNPDDIVILYYSGHGKIDYTKGEAFLGTYNMDFNNPSANGISIKQFNDLLDSIPSRNKVIFLDACHSGEINKDAWSQNATLIPASGTGGNMATGNLGQVKGDSEEMRDPGESDPFDLMLELFTDLYQGNGTNIVVAARGLEAAKECNEIKHGVFTYAVLNGISDLTADEDTNKILTVGELQNYTIRNTTIFSSICDSNKIQRASVRKENEFNDWPIIASDSVLHFRKSKVREIFPKNTSASGAPGIIVNANPGINVEIEPVLASSEPNKEKSEKPTEETRVAERTRRLTFREHLEKLKEDGKQIGKEISTLVSNKKGVEFLRNYQKTEHPNAKLLFQNSSFTVHYELIKQQLVFNINCSGYYPGIWVDVNGNKTADACIDMVYKKVPNADSITVQNITIPGQSSSCDSSMNLQSTAAILAVDKGYLFVLPANEIKKGNTKKVKINFSFENNENKETKSYSQEEIKKLFDEAIEINIVP